MDVAASIDDAVLVADVSRALGHYAVVARIARALKANSTGGTPPIDSVISAIDSSRRLLVVDGASTDDASGSVIESFLESCPRLTVLATGPTPLDVNDEL